MDGVGEGRQNQEAVGMAPLPAKIDRKRALAAIEKAARRFKAFRGREPHRGEILYLHDPGTIALVVGELVGVWYRVNERERGRLHKFNRSSRPLLCVSADGKQAFIVKGRWSFTPRGFVG